MRNWKKIIILVLFASTPYPPPPLHLSLLLNLPLVITRSLKRAPFVSRSFTVSPCFPVMCTLIVYLWTVNVATGKGRDVSLHDGKIRKLLCQYLHAYACAYGVVLYSIAQPEDPKALVTKLQSRSKCNPLGHASTTRLAHKLKAFLLTLLFYTKKAFALLLIPARRKERQRGNLTNPALTFWKAKPEKRTPDLKECPE